MFGFAEFPPLCFRESVLFRRPVVIGLAPALAGRQLNSSSEFAGAQDLEVNISWRRNFLGWLRSTEPDDADSSTEYLSTIRLWSAPLTKLCPFLPWKENQTSYKLDKGGDATIQTWTAEVCEMMNAMQFITGLQYGNKYNIQLLSTNPES